MMTSARHYESQEVRNNTDSGIREHFIELCISVIAAAGCIIGSRVYK